MFKDNMLTYAENLILKRRQLMYEKKVNEVISRTNYKLDYQQKASYVEGQIERLIKFFRRSTGNAVNDQLMADI